MRAIRKDLFLRWGRRAWTLLIVAACFGSGIWGRNVDDQNLQSAEQSYRRGFATEAEHYLERIPASSEVRSSQQYLELRTLLHFYTGDIVSARRELAQLHSGRRIDPSNADPFDLYYLEELFALRQFPLLSILKSDGNSDWSDFEKRLAQASYPLFACTINRDPESGAWYLPGKVPLQKHLLFKDPLAFDSVRGRKANPGDVFQLALLARIARSYAAIKNGRPVSNEASPGRELRLCRESLERQMEKSGPFTESTRSELEEYLYRLYFAQWALTNSVDSLFDLADFLYRGKDDPGKAAESIYLFRMAAARLIAELPWKVDSHAEAGESRRSRFFLAMILRKLETLYGRLDRPGDAKTVASMAGAIEEFLYATSGSVSAEQAAQSMAAMRRGILDACSEDRSNRESFVFRILFAGDEKARALLQRTLSRRDADAESSELFSVMEFRYGELSP